MDTDARELSGVVVVGVDGSPASHHALRWALEEASIRGARLEVVHAWDTPLPISAIASVIAPHDPAIYESEAKSRLETVLGSLGTHTPSTVSIEGRTVRGYPPSVLLRALDHADLLVLGSRGLGGFRGLLLGSVSHRCTQHAPRPVAVVPETAPLPGDSEVVVGVDGSPGSSLTLQWAIEEAAARGARLVVANAWDAAYMVPPEGMAVAPPDRARYLEQSQHVLHEVADGPLSRAVRQPAAVEFSSIEAPAAQGLLDRSANAGLLVVGSHGRSGLARIMLGSVSQQCVHHAKCAVVVVPAWQEESHER